ncbi:MAG: Wzz/FepE/Etk N-terminal domain-containing protein [Planctomycetota bacterium]
MATALRIPEPRTRHVTHERQEPEARLETRELRSALKRRWKLIAVPALIAPVLAALFATFLPKQYRSETRLLVQRDTVLNPLVGPPTAAALAAEERLKQFDKLVRTRASLLGVAEELGFLPESETARDELAADMGQRLETWAGGGESFLLAFTDPDPVRARTVCETLSARFIDDMVEDSIRDAREAVAHLGLRVEDQSEVAGALREALRVYEKEHQGVLPASQGAVLDRLQRLEGELEQLVIAHELIPKQRDHLRALLIDTDEMVLDQERVDESRHPKVDEKFKLEVELALLLKRARETHPDVIRLRQQIAELEAGIREEFGARPTREDYTSSPYVTRQRVYRVNQAFTELQGSLLALDIRQAELERQIEGYQKTLSPLREKVEMFAQIRADHERMTREADMSAQQRDKLVTQHAGAFEQLEIDRAQERSKFRILEPARVPTRHYKPSRSRITLAGGFVGLLFGVLLAFLAELTDPFLRRGKDIEGATHGRAPLLIRLPRIEPRR